MVGQFGPIMLTLRIVSQVTVCIVTHISHNTPQRSIPLGSIRAFTLCISQTCCGVVAQSLFSVCVCFKSPLHGWFLSSLALKPILLQDATPFQFNQLYKRHLHRHPIPIHVHPFLSVLLCSGSRQASETLSTSQLLLTDLAFSSFSSLPTRQHI